MVSLSESKGREDSRDFLGSSNHCSPFLTVPAELSALTRRADALRLICSGWKAISVVKKHGISLSI
jgi:hypothetical protein